MVPDADPDPAIFVSDLQDVNKIFFFFLKVFLLFTFRRYGTFFRDKKSYRSYKTIGINSFLTIFAW
jgi:hypothetical protein